jgi:hypothetical protein
MINTQKRSSSDEHRAIDGHLLRAAFAVVGSAILLLYATGSFRQPSLPPQPTLQIFPAPLL